jgi:hypothetical protein
MEPLSMVVICSLTWLWVGTIAPFLALNLAMVTREPWTIWRVIMGFKRSSATSFQL